MLLIRIQKHSKYVIESYLNLINNFCTIILHCTEKALIANIRKLHKSVCFLVGSKYYFLDSFIFLYPRQDYDINNVVEKL